MSPEAQLAYESRVRTRQTIVSVAAGVLLMAASILSLTGPHAKVNELTLGLITDHRRGTLDLISAIIGALADIGLGWTLVFLYRCGKARSDPSRSTGYIPILAIIGTALSAIAGIADIIVVTHAVNQFLSTGSQTYDEANRLTSGGLLLVLQILGQLASLIIAIAFVMVSLIAMRVGLLPRFLGYVGMAAGALTLLPIISVGGVPFPIVQLYFLVCVALLFIGRWPSGPIKAWQTGQAEAWPSSAELRARNMQQAEANRKVRQDRRAAAGGGSRRRRGRELPGVVTGDPGDTGTATAEATDDVADVTDGNGATNGNGNGAQGAGRPTPSRPGSQRRKRKHRR